jgi:CP12 domain
MKTIESFSANSVSDVTSLDDRIQAAIAEARATSATYGATSTKAAVAWDIVEELEAEAAHQRVNKAEHTALTDYCNEFPDALEARMYDV